MIIGFYYIETVLTIILILLFADIKVIRMDSFTFFYISSKSAILASLIRFCIASCNCKAFCISICLSCDATYRPYISNSSSLGGKLASLLNLSFCIPELINFIFFLFFLHNVTLLFTFLIHFEFVSKL